MKFCKKCHKIIIKNVFTCKEFGNKCRCDGDMVRLVEGSEIFGLTNTVLSKVKRCGKKRKVVKNVNSS